VDGSGNLRDWGTDESGREGARELEMRWRLPVSVSRTAVAAIGLVALGTVVLPTAAQAARRTPTYYVSVGDSYSVGYQPALPVPVSTPGYAVYVAKRTHLTLVNFGCAGATTSSILDSVGCPDVLAHTVGALVYPTSTQAAAAEAFVAAHHGHIGLITVTIGGNDVTACIKVTDPIPCVAGAVSSITNNVATLASGLRAAAGPKVPIIGLTYPDVILGEYVWPTRPPTAAQISLATESVPAFKSLINPALSKAYSQAGASFVDVTAATGAYTSLTRTVRLKQYGTIPLSVARVCTLSWFCAEGNIHATTKGYTLIGKLVVARYATLHRT
jgi:lysophospholipase L1-like esterase